MKTKNRYIQFEYDLEFHGGDYDKVGEYAYVPIELIEKMGEEEAFEKVTGINAVHIIFYTMDEVYDAKGNQIEE